MHHRFEKLRSSSTQEGMERNQKIRKFQQYEWILRVFSIVGSDVIGSSHQCLVQTREKPVVGSGELSGLVDRCHFVTVCAVPALTLMPLDWCVVWCDVQNQIKQNQMSAKVLALGAVATAGLAALAYREYKRSSEAAAAAESAAVKVEAVGPYRLAGAVVRGFQRGSKLLGFPTAYLDPAAFAGVLDNAPHGVYIGFASVAGGSVHRAFISVGLNPTFKNKQITVEAYIDHVFPSDFYGQNLSLVIVGYLRPQLAFDGIDKLIKAIKLDVTVGTIALNSQRFKSAQTDPIFSSTKSTTATATATATAAASASK